MGKFRVPEFLPPVGAFIYVEGPSGEPVGRGYHGYETLSGTNRAGDEVSVLIGRRAAIKYILRRVIYEPLGFCDDTAGGRTFHDYRVEDGVLYGLHGSDDPVPLGSWPPEEACRVG